MRRLTFRLLIAALTFVVGVAFAYVWYIRHSSPVAPTKVNQPAPAEIHAPSEQNVYRDGELIVKRDGWEVPDVSSLRVSQRGVWRTTETAAPVNHTMYELAGELLMPKKNFDGTVDPVRKVRVNSLIVFDIGGRRFCYRMLVWDVPAPGESGVGVVFYQTFYDLDGDGKFESWDVSDTLSKPLKMPHWSQK
jgi:hypothetical protein